MVSVPQPFTVVRPLVEMDYVRPRWGRRGATLVNIHEGGPNPMEFLTDDLVDTARDAVRAKAREVMGRERWTYEEVAARARVGKATVTRFLNGDPRSHRYWPREEQIKSLSEGFGF